MAPQPTPRRPISTAGQLFPGKQEQVPLWVLCQLDRVASIQKGEYNTGHIRLHYIVADCL